MDDLTHITLGRDFLDQAAELAAQCSSELSRERVTVSQAVALGIRAFIEETWQIATSDGRSSEIKYVDILDVCDFSANGWRIEVRVITESDEPALYVPTMPLIVGVLSDFYIAARIDPSLSRATVLGFASAQDLASAELTRNGMFAVLPDGDLSPFSYRPSLTSHHSPPESALRPASDRSSLITHHLNPPSASQSPQTPNAKICTPSGATGPSV